MRINKSQVVNALRSAKAAKDQGGSALASLQDSARALGVATYIHQRDVDALESAFLTSGEDGAVRLATENLRAQGWVVIDGDVEAEPMGVASIATSESAEAPATLESASEILRSALVEGGKPAVSTAVVDLITKAGLIMPQASDMTGLVDEIVQAIVGNGDLEEVLEDARERLSSEADKAEDEEDEEERTMEERVSDLEETVESLVNVAKRHGLL